jgi:adenine phosphoribosyltransferase
LKLGDCEINSSRILTRNFAAMTDQLRARLRGIPDFPKPGILFQDITPILGDPLHFRQAVELMAAPFVDKGIVRVAAVEARGFILGGPVALALGCGFIPLRKPGKLPWERMRQEYALEYGTDALEAHRDAIPAGGRVLIVDDVLATGGTAAAAGHLVGQLGGEVAGWSFLLKIGALGGTARLTGAPVHAVLAV